MRRMMSGLAAVAMVIAWTLPASAADESKVKAATNQVESGAKKVGDGKVGDGVTETAKGVGNTVVEGAKFTGEKFKEAGHTAEPKVKGFWSNLKEGNIKESANSFGEGVKGFFTRLFSN